MPLSQEQHDQLVSNYITRLVDGMDIKTLVNCLTEQLIINVSGGCHTDEELIEEISRFYDEDEVAAMLEDVEVDPADFNIHNSLDE